MAEPETEKVHCKFIEQRGKAYVLENEAGVRDFFPASQVSFPQRNNQTGECLAEIPIWLLNQKGW